MKLFALSINGTKIPTITGVPSGGLEGGGKNLVQASLNLIVIVGIIMAVVFILWSGIQWILSGGEKQKLEQARHRLTYSIIGLLVIVCSFFIVSVVLTLIGATPSFFLNTPAVSPPCTSANCREDRPQTQTLHCLQDNCNGDNCSSLGLRCKSEISAGGENTCSCR